MVWRWKVKTWYKVLVDGKSNHGGNLEWDLPKNGKPGKWHTVKGEILKCSNGLHLTEKPYEWFKWKCDIYIAEGKGQNKGDESKTAFRSARLIKKIDKPEWLENAEKFVKEIVNIKWFCNGKLPKIKKIKMFKTQDAARDAVRAAAGDAAWGAAWEAARDAARGAAWDAVRGAAWEAARDAAWGAVRDAAWGAARRAAWEAARDAARDAAWDAARDAALMAQCFVAELTGKHFDHAKLRWSIWEAGYGVYCDVDGILYCYKKL
jgi:hypothetical protein